MNIVSLEVNDRPCSDPSTLANAFNDYFVNIGPSLNHNSESFPSTQKIGDDEDLTHSSQEINFYMCTESAETIFSCLQTLPTKKATGCDNMPAYLIKEAAPVIVYSLTNIINYSIVTGKVPKQWKQARVTPVHKGGDKTIMNNYRPISTHPFLSKVIERVVYNQLMYHLESNALLPPQQSGFRHGFSTMPLLLNITTSWMRTIDDGCYVGAVFLDLHKAFDTVDHEILLSKLAEIGMKGSSLGWFRSYLTDRIQCLQLGE